MKGILKNQGLTIVEILVSLALALTFVTGVSQLISVGLKASDVSRKRATAVQLASEGMEAMYNIRRNNSDTFFTIGTITGGSSYYQPVFASGVWSLNSKISTTPVPTLAPFPGFSRNVKVDRVNRLGGFCKNDISDSASCPDDNSMKITVTITWYEGGVQKTYQTIGLLTNI